MMYVYGIYIYTYNHYTAILIIAAICVLYAKRHRRRGPAHACAETALLYVSQLLLTYSL